MSQSECDSSGKESFEIRRLAELSAYRILGTPPEPVFDDLAEIVRIRFDVPIAIISFIGESDAFFKSHLGIDIESAPRYMTFCDRAIQEEKPIIVYDAPRSENYKDNPFVVGPPYVQFYAGVRIVTPNGVPIGAVSAIDTITRSPGKSDVEFMIGIAKLVMDVLEMRRATAGTQKPSSSSASQLGAGV